MRAIKKRQKGFLAPLLAVVIGLLPTVSVWASEYTANIKKADRGIYKFKITVNGSAIATTNWEATGTVTFDVEPKDEIKFENGVAISGTFGISYVDEDETGLTLSGDEEHTGELYNHKIIVPGGDDFTEELDAVYGWNVVIELGSSGGTCVNNLNFSSL